jgi:phosphoribosylformimino-5-aminoimidazole carboxamide ribotide isomerase
VRDVIALELDKVGTKSGIDFDFLARAVDVSGHDILCGGGVRSYEDVYEMQEIGVKGALVATAVHDGAIPLSLLRKTFS